MLSNQLKQYTKTNHQTLEKIVMGRIKNIHSMNDYGKILSLYFGFVCKLENDIDKHFNNQLLPDYFQRIKTEFILSDLQHLGMHVPLLATKEFSPPINDIFQAIGALYVLEGSTLGGTIISKIIKNQLSLKEDEGLSYFNVYKDQTVIMWDKFKIFLDTTNYTSIEEEIILTSANDTFMKLVKWFIENPGSDDN